MQEIKKKTLFKLGDKKGKVHFYGRRLAMEWRRNQLWKNLVTNTDVVIIHIYTHTHLNDKEPLITKFSQEEKGL